MRGMPFLWFEHTQKAIAGVLVLPFVFSYKNNYLKTEGIIR